MEWPVANVTRTHQSVFLARTAFPSSNHRRGPETAFEEVSCGASGLSSITRPRVRCRTEQSPTWIDSKLRESPFAAACEIRITLPMRFTWVSKSG